MSRVVIEVEERNARGKNESRRQRREGKIPAILYGSGKPVLPLTVDPREIDKVLHSETGENTLLQLRLKGKDMQRQVMIKDYQLDPISGRVVHTDFIRIEMDTRVEISVPVHATGVAPGVKEQGGLLEIVQRELVVECLPADIPEHIDIDVNALRIGDQVRVQDLNPEDKIQIKDPPDTVVVTVIPPRLVEEEVEAKPEEEAEPEVISKGKKEEEGEEPKSEAKDKPEAKASE